MSNYVILNILTIFAIFSHGLCFIQTYQKRKNFKFYTNTIQISNENPSSLNIENDIFEVLNEDEYLKSYIGNINTSELKLEPIEGGISNYCYKLSHTQDQFLPIFIKHSKNNLKLLSDVELSSERLRYEYLATKAYSKYTPQILPNILHYHHTKKLLFYQYLNHHIRLTDCLIHGNIAVEINRAMGTILGRSHARTYHALLPATQINRYLNEFINSEHMEMWNNHFFQPSLSILQQALQCNTNNDNKNNVENTDIPSDTNEENIHVHDEQYIYNIIDHYLNYIDTLSTHTNQNNTTNNTLEIQISKHNKDDNKLRKIVLSSSMIHILKEYNNNHNNNHNDNNQPMIIQEAIEHLQHIYNTKKQCLVHGDLTGNNILIDNEHYYGIDNKNNFPFKVVDFEKAYFGPAGLDLGIVLANYLWYYVAHSNPSIRRTILSGVLAIIDAYKSAFTVQMSSILKSNIGAETTSAATAMNIDVTSIQDMLDEILIDSIGFMGLYTYFLLFIIPDIQLLPYHTVDGHNWGDIEGRKEACRCRLLKMALESLSLYHTLIQKKSQNKQDDTISTQQVFSTLFNLDEEFLNKDHPTEFWY